MTYIRPGRTARKPDFGKARKPDLPPCRHPGCAKAAGQAGWGCLPHWYKLTPDLRARLYAAAVSGDRRAWTAVAEDADRHVADQLARERRPAWREPELPL